MAQVCGIRINQNGYQVSFDSQRSMSNHFESQAIQPIILLISFSLKIIAMFYQQLIITCHTVLSTIYFHHNFLLQQHGIIIIAISQMRKVRIVVTHTREPSQKQRARIWIVTLLQTSYWL